MLAASKLESEVDIEMLSESLAGWLRWPSDTGDPEEDTDQPTPLVHWHPIDSPQAPPHGRSLVVSAEGKIRSPFANDSELF
jgi:hypothetical protein